MHERTINSIPRNIVVKKINKITKENKNELMLKDNLINVYSSCFQTGLGIEFVIFQYT